MIPRTPRTAAALFKQFRDGRISKIRWKRTGRGWTATIHFVDEDRTDLISGRPRAVIETVDYSDAQKEAYDRLLSAAAHRNGARTDADKVGALSSLLPRAEASLALGNFQ